jgi:hypothetical protein
MRRVRALARICSTGCIEKWAELFRNHLQRRYQLGRQWQSVCSVAAVNFGVRGKVHFGQVIHPLLAMMALRNAPRGRCA